METRKLNRVVIKEEIFSLTNDTFEAIILGQLIYWQERVEDFDKFLIEESERKKNNGEEKVNIVLQNGWIYKSSKQLIKECMLTISEVTARRYLQNLIEKHFVECRKNPINKWDKKLQYRVNISFVIQEIQKLGYDGLSGYSLLKLQNEAVNLQNEVSVLQNEAAIIETTNKDYNIDNKEIKDKSFIKKEPIDFDFILSAWNEIASNVDALSKIRDINDKRKTCIKNLIKNCNTSVDEIIKVINTIPYADDWVLGRGNRKWAIDFDFLIKNTSNWYIKALEGGLHKNNIEKFNEIMKNDNAEKSQNGNLIIGGIEYK